MRDTRLDLLVGIDEGNAHLGGDQLADRRFSGAHQADKHEIALPSAGAERVSAAAPVRWWFPP